MSPSPAAETGWIVEVESGPARGFRLGIEHEVVLVGSGEAAGVRIPDEAMSPYHIELVPLGEALEVRDLGSRTGTWLEGLGGRIEIGRIRLTSAAELLAGDSRIGLLPARDAGPGLAARPPHRVQSAGTDIEPDDAASRLIGRSNAMRVTRARIRAYSGNNATVLITGETGTGKELAARAIHALSARSRKPLVTLNCGAVPRELAESTLFGHERGAFSGATAASPGVFREADGGTLFLDEVQSLPLDLQPKLLRALQEGEIRPVGGAARCVNVRILAASNAELPALVNEGRFRDDLFYRLNVVPLRMPPLRDRREDLDVLVPALLETVRSKHKLPPSDRSPEELIALAKERDFPGNVRDLESFLVRHCAGIPEEETSPPPGGSMSLDRLWALPLEEAVKEFRKLYFARALEETGSVTGAATRAGVHRSTVHRGR